MGDCLCVLDVGIVAAYLDLCGYCFYLPCGLVQADREADRSSEPVRNFVYMRLHSHVLSTSTFFVSAVESTTVTNFTSNTWY